MNNCYLMSLLESPFWSHIRVPHPHTMLRRHYACTEQCSLISKPLKIPPQSPSQSIDAGTSNQTTPSHLPLPSLPFPNSPSIPSPSPTPYSLHPQPPYPCLCLCFGFFEQIIYTYPFLLTLCNTHPISSKHPIHPSISNQKRHTLHPSHNFFTLLLTFIPLEKSSRAISSRGLCPSSPASVCRPCNNGGCRLGLSCCLELMLKVRAVQEEYMGREIRRGGKWEVCGRCGYGRAERLRRRAVIAAFARGWSMAWFLVYGVRYQITRRGFLKAEIQCSC